MPKVIAIENLSKRYRLGLIGTRSFYEDFERWKAKLQGKADPFVKIGEQDHGNRADGYIWALRNINLEVEQGEIVGIIGLNGAGKSTLLKILSRITAPTSGRIKIKGRFSSLLEVGTGFHPELTGRENVYLNGTIMGMNRGEIDRKFDEIVDFSEVENYIDTPVKRYSSGMRVRLGFAVAAHLDPDILVVDEVLAVGDVAFQKKSLGKMSEVSRQGRTVLFVSHNMQVILRLVERCALLERGQLKKVGEPRQVVDAYLRSGVAQDGELVFPMDENKVAQLTRMSLRNRDNEIVTALEYDEDITLEICFLVRQTGVGRVDVSGLVSQVDGPPVLQYGTYEIVDAPERWPIGENRIRVVFPGGMLRSGQYVCRTAVNLSDKAHHNHPNFGLGIAFDIDDQREVTADDFPRMRRSSILMAQPKYLLEQIS